MLKKLVPHRGIRLALEIVIFMLVYFAIKTYVQRDLVDGKAPFLEGTLINGQPVDLQSYRGKPVLLHFWATWCSVCKLEENSISAISKEHAVITVAMNSGSDSQVSSYLQVKNLSYPVIMDENGIIAQRFGVRGVPTSFILDPSGYIAYTEVGYTTSWGLRFRLWMAQD